MNMTTREVQPQDIGSQKPAEPVMFEKPPQTPELGHVEAMRGLEQKRAQITTQRHVVGESSTGSNPEQISVDERNRLANRGGRLAIIADTGLLGLKLIGALTTGSWVLMAESVDSLVDVGKNIAYKMSIKLGSRPPDEDHHFGHKKYEALVGLAAGAVILAGAGTLLVSAFHDAVEGITHSIEPAAAAFEALTMAAKIPMSIWFLKQAKKLNSPALKAVGIDSKSDSIRAVGGLGAIALSLVGFPQADMIMGGIMAVMIGKSALELIGENIGYVSGESPGRDVLERINNLTLIQLEAYNKLRKEQNPRSHEVSLDIERIDAEKRVGSTIVLIKVRTNPEMTVRECEVVRTMVKKALRDSGTVSSEHRQIYVHFHENHQEEGKTRTDGGG